MKGIVKYSVILVSIFLVSSFTYLTLPNLSKAQAVSWIMEDNTVFVDIPNKGRISQTPHTLTDFSNQPAVEFTSHFDTEQCFDFAFGFDTDNAKPIGAVYYDPHYTNTIMNYTCNSKGFVAEIVDRIYYCGNSYFNYTNNPRKTGQIEHFWCWQDCATEYMGENTSETRLLFDHDFDDLTIDTMTAFWNDPQLVEWIDISNKLSVLNESHFGMDVWYVIQDVIFQPNEAKTIKPNIQIKPSLGENSGKYDVLIKRCSDTIQQAIGSENYVLIDPWWNISWDYRMPFYINENSNLQRVNGTFELVFDSSALWPYINATCSDFRLTDGDDNLLPAIMILYCNLTNTTIRFNYTLAPGVNQTFYLYYSNTAASSVNTSVSLFRQKIDMGSNNWAMATSYNQTGLTMNNLAFYGPGNYGGSRSAISKSYNVSTETEAGITNAPQAVDYSVYGWFNNSHCYACGDLGSEVKSSKMACWDGTI